MRAWWRRLRFGLSTILGLKPLGFFIPYRYAGSTEALDYPALVPLFNDAAPRFREVLSEIERHSEGLRRIASGNHSARFGQDWFPRLDAAAAYALVLGSAARRIVEVGSGHSTRFLARAARDLGHRTSVEVGRETIVEHHARTEPVRITCIDPQPRASLAGLDIDWRREVLGPQHLPLFAGLRSGDIAFFDSSHLLWPGTDVDLILNRILPALRPGVLVHVHDVFLPDPYPAGWAWRGYTEQLGLAGYLTSPAWRIVWASHYAVTRQGAAERPAIAALPMPDGARESSLWLVRRHPPT